MNFDEDNKSKISNNMKDHNELSPYLFDSKNDKENLARSAKKCLLKSKNVIENTLKETIDDFEQKLGKLEAELDPRNSNRNIFQNERNQSLNSFYLRNNENSLCQMLDQKIDKMFEKIKKPLKFDHFETPEKNSFKKTENPHMKDGFEDETR